MERERVTKVKRRVLKMGVIVGMSTGLFFTELLVPSFTAINWVAAEEAAYEYVSVTGNNVIIYSDFGRTISPTAKVAQNQTFHVKESETKGIMTYLGLYDANEFVGYIDASQVTRANGPEGIEKIVRQYVEVIVNTSVYEDFDWTTTSDTSPLMNKTYKVKSLFHHLNGEVYLSLYDTADNWVGYVEQSATVSSTKEAFQKDAAVVAEPKEKTVATEKTATIETSETKEATSTSETSETTTESSESTTSSESDTATTDSVTRLPAEDQGTMDEAIDTSQKNTSKHFINGTSVLPALTSPVKQANNVTTKDEPRRVTASATADTITWKDNASFIQAIAPAAQKLADEYGLYPSVMIAQAALESGFGASKLSKDANNLFGIKYSSGDEGKFERYDISSDEFINGVRVTLPATFRKYATVSDSLLDNAKLLAKGLSWNTTFYQGAWRKNAATYKEATQSLTGKYATDPQYHTKLNQLIATWDLTKYD